MDLHTTLEILGLNPGADAKAIKRAYHKRLKVTKPDRDPEGFKHLREAYEVATSDEPPQTAADRVRVSKRLRQALGANMVMEFGFRVGRLARLGPEPASVEAAAR